MKIKLSDISPNPFRHIERYPIREDKIEALRESIRTTEFWDNVVARVTDGGAEIAYGHHRLEALRREYGPDHEIDLIVRELDDELMLKIMANENMEQWGNVAAIEHETLRSVVQAYAEGKIQLSPPASKGRESYRRNAPSFVQGDVAADREHMPYTAQTVADFLGWTESPGGKAQRRVNDGLSALELIESGALDEKAFAGLTSYQAAAVVQQARKAARVAEAKAKRQRELAEKQAKAAEKARKQAEKAAVDRQKAAEQAAQAKDDAGRRKAEQDEQDARRKEAAARKAEREATRESEAAAAQEKVHHAEGQQAAKTVGGDTAADLKAGTTTYQTAFKSATKSKPEPEPVDIDEYAKRMAGRLFRMFDPEYHELALKLDELIKFRKHMTPIVALNLSRELSSLAARVEEYRTKLARDTDEAPDRDPDIEILDAEVVPDTMKEITK